MSESEFSVAVGSGVHMLPGNKARSAAAVFNYGNILAVLLPIPLGLLWLGMSMLVYAMNRHHPNPRVGYYTQQAAYRFYGISGFFVAAATFIPGGGWNYYLAAWGLAAAILVPWSILDVRRIRGEHWDDLQIPVEENDAHSH